MSEDRSHAYDVVANFFQEQRRRLQSTLFPYTTLFRSRIMDKLHETGMDKNTLVFYTTDNGAWQDVYPDRSEEHTSELQSRRDIVCRLLLEKKKSKVEVSSNVIIIR